MPALTLTFNGANGQPHDWRHVSVPLNQIKTLLNTTKLDYLNLQANGIRWSNIRAHNGLKGGNIRVYNDTGSTLNEEDIVFHSSFHDDGTDEYPEVTKAFAATTAGASRFAFGILTEDITTSNAGNMAQYHEITGIDTSSYTLMAPVWLNTTAGGYTLDQPALPARCQCIGYVSKVDASTGRIQFCFPGFIVPYSIADEVL